MINLAGGGPESLVANPQMVTRIQNDIADKLAAIPGVSPVGFAAAVPMEGIDPNWDQMQVEGKNYEGGDPPLRLFNSVSPGYFKAAGTRLVAGRDLTWTDLYGLRPAAMVSETLPANRGARLLPPSARESASFPAGPGWR